MDLERISAIRRDQAPTRPKVPGPAGLTVQEVLMKQERNYQPLLVVLQISRWSLSGWMIWRDWNENGAAPQAGGARV